MRDASGEGWTATRKQAGAGADYAVAGFLGGQSSDSNRAFSPLDIVIFARNGEIPTRLDFQTHS